MKKYLGIIGIMLLISSQAGAAIGIVGNPQYVLTAPDTIASLQAIVGCEDFSLVTDNATGITYQENCANTPNITQFFPLTIATFPGLSAALAAKYDASNPSSYIGASALTPYLTISGAAGIYEPIITASISAKYWRGDKTFQTLDTSAVPENGNLYFTGTRAVTALTGQNISLFTNDSGYLTSASATAIYVPQTTTINGHALSSNVTVTKGDVGLGNADNTSDLNKPVSTATQTALNGKFANPAGTTSQYLRGDGTTATFPTLVSAFSNDAGYLTSSSSIASSQITGTKTDSFISNFVTAARNAISVTGDGSYNSSTGVITVNSSSAPSVSGLTLNISGTGATGTQISSSKFSQIGITYSTQFTYSLTGTPSSGVVLKTCATNSATESDWVEAGRTSQTLSAGLAITVGQAITNTGQIITSIPPTYYVKAESIGSGTHTESFVSGQQTIFN